MKKSRYTVFVVHKGKQWSKSVDQIPFVIGRGVSADVQISSDLLSREQIRVGKDENGFWLEDLGSSNGTFIEQKPVPPKSRVPYKEGESIQIGQKLGFYLSISAQETFNSEVIPFPQEQKVEVPHKKVANGPVQSAPRKVTPAPVAVDQDFINAMTTAEKNLFEQIKKMVGNEAQEIHQAAWRKAEEITQRAEKEKERVIKEAREQAAREIKAQQEAVTEKLQELHKTKAQLGQERQLLETEVSSRKNKVKELSLAEENYQQKLAELKKEIFESEERYKRQAEEAEADLAKLNQEKEKFASEYEEFKLEERKTRSKLEAEVLEAKVGALKIQTEAAQLQEKIEHLKPELERLYSDKARLEETQQSIRHKIHEEESVLAKLKGEQAQLKAEEQKVRDSLEFQRSECDRVQVSAEKLMEDAQNEVRELMKRNEARAAALIADALKKVSELEQEAELLKQGHQEEIQRFDVLKDELRRQSDQKQTEAQNQCDLLLREAQEATEKQREELQAEISEVRVRKEALEVEILSLDRQRIQKIEETKQVIQEKLDKARLDADVLIAKGQEASDLLIKQDRLIFEDEIRRIRAEAESQLENARRSAQNILAEAESEMRAQRIKEQHSSAELKQLTMLEIKELRTQGEEEILRRKHEHAKNVTANVYALVTSEMFKAKDKVLDVTMIDEFTKGIKDLIFDTMLDRVGPDQDKLQEILKVSADAKSKEKQYWQRFKVTTFSALFAAMTLIAFPQIITYPKQKIIAAFTEKSSNGSEEFMNQVQEARQKAIYNPSTTAEFKPSYVENILFTTDFMTKLQDQAYQDKWILDLNDYFINVMDVKDTTIIKFVSLESSFLKDLTRIKSDIDAQNPDVKIEEMKSREQEFKKKLAEVFESPEKVSQYYGFHQKFWNEFYHPRKPAHQSSP
jgi:pSer/pThr/pTyr-binding forkhead associated (FHA) protein